MDADDVSKLQFRVSLTARYTHRHISVSLHTSGTSYLSLFLRTVSIVNKMLASLPKSLEARTVRRSISDDRVFRCRDIDGLTAKGGNPLFSNFTGEPKN